MGGLPRGVRHGERDAVRHVVRPRPLLGPEALRPTAGSSPRTRRAPRCGPSSRTTSTGSWPIAVSPDSMTASVPSNTALATSLTSARVGAGASIIVSSICVAVMTGVPTLTQWRMICFCRCGTSSSGQSMPRSPRATITRVGDLGDRRQLAERRGGLDLGDDAAPGRRRPRAARPRRRRGARTTAPRTRRPAAVTASASSRSCAVGANICSRSHDRCTPGPALHAAAALDLGRDRRRRRARRRAARCRRRRGRCGRRDRRRGATSGSRPRSPPPCSARCPGTSGRRCPARGRRRRPGTRRRGSSVPGGRRARRSAGRRRRRPRGRWRAARGARRSGRG